MVTIPYPTSAQRLPEPHRCGHGPCGAIIPTGTTKPRTFCCDACRKAEARFRTGGPLPYRATNSNASTAEFPRFRTKKSNEIKGQILANNGPSTTFNLVGGERTSGCSLDPKITKKILAAEIGVPTGIVTSPDGVTATITPKHGGR
jgi:hypothetical protein